MDIRKYSRLPQGSEINFYNNNNENIFSSNVWNVSKGGVLVVHCDNKIVQVLSEGKEIRFKFAIPTGEVSGIARVTWLDKKNLSAGLEFLKIHDGLLNLYLYTDSEF